MNQWNCTIWELCLRIIWLALAGLAIIGALRLCAWADTGSRGECPAERHLIPNVNQ
jgi:hypothetical protein